MGWIKVGEINIYSISDDVSTLTNAFFEFMVSLMNPYFAVIFTAFVITLMIYILYGAMHQIEHVGD